MLLALPLGLLVGLVIGAVGGGGAILALPVLVYVAGEEVSAATTESLVVVALAATTGVASLARDRQVCWRLALGFAAVASLGAVVGAVAGRGVSAALLLLAFVPVMLAAARAMWRRGRPSAVLPPAPDACPAVRPLRLVAAGAGTGVLTGFFGVGGGFVIVPVLTLLLGMGARRAIASSLAIVALTALAALAAHLAGGARLDVTVTAAFAGVAALGALLGTGLGRRLPAVLLARAFAVVVASVAVMLLLDVVVLGGPPGA